MPNPTVRVTFQRDTFSYSPNDGNVEMDGAGDITLDRAGGSWSFTGVEITPPSDNFRVTSLSDDRIVIRNEFRSKGRFNYCITIQTNDGERKSDPEIINKG